VPNSSEARALDRLLAGAERAISLLERCRPINAAAETERVAERWEAGEPTAAHFRYGPRPLLDPALRMLEAVATALSDADPWESLYRARALELLQEAWIVESIGTPDIAERAGARFPVDHSSDGALAAAAADSWISLSSAARGPRILSDDSADPRSLVSQIGGLAGLLRLPVRISLSRDMACAAATGDGLIVVRTGVSHTPEAARRIALHEVYGHVAPRAQAAREALGLFAIGTAGASDDEEGRAVLIEERHELLDDPRRRELAARHLGAVSVRAGADFVEAVRVLLARGVSPRDAVFVVARVCRGGGLARELVYLPALFRVRSTLAADPGLEAWLERGRVSVAAARTLRLLGEPPATSIPSAPVKARGAA